MVGGLVLNACDGQGAVDLAGEVALEAAHDFGFGLAFGGASSDVDLGGLVPVHAGDDGSVQRGVGLPVAASVEAVAGDFTGRGRNRVSAAQGGERGFAVEPVGVVAGREQERCCGVGSYAGQLKKRRRGRGREGGQLLAQLQSLGLQG